MQFCPHLEPDLDGQGVPPPGRVGYVPCQLDRVQPHQDLDGVPPSGPGMGVWTWDGSIPHLDLGWGTTTRKDGVPPVSWMKLDRHTPVKT